MYKLLTDYVNCMKEHMCNIYKGQMKVQFFSDYAIIYTTVNEHIKSIK